MPDDSFRWTRTRRAFYDAAHRLFGNSIDDSITSNQVQAVMTAGKLARPYWLVDHFAIERGVYRFPGIADVVPADNSTGTGMENSPRAKSKPATIKQEAQEEVAPQTPSVRGDAAAEDIKAFQRHPAWQRICNPHRQSSFFHILRREAKEDHHTYFIE